jgi:acyl dehydratase
MRETRISITIEKTLTQDDFDRFAKLSGDDNPIHIDPDFSVTTRFGRTVAHGLLLNSILRGLVDQLVPGARQLSQQLTFPAPTYADDLLRFTATVDADDGETVRATITSIRTSDEVTTCEGLTTLRRGGG